MLEGRDSWKVLLGSPEIISVSVRGCTFVGGLFTTSSEFLVMLTAKSWEGLSRVPLLYYFICLLGNQAILLCPLCV